MGASVLLASAPPRVAILSVHTSPIAELGGHENGGMNVYVRETCRELARRGIATDIFTRRTHPDQPQALSLAPRSRLIHVTAGPPAPLEKGDQFAHLPEFVEEVYAWAQSSREAYAAVHSHYWLSGWVAAQLAGRWHVPWLHTAHTLGRVKNALAAEGAVLESDERIQVEQAIVRHSDVLIASTHAESDDLVELYGAAPGKIRVIPGGVDSETFRPRRSAALRRRLGLEGRRVVLFIGRLERLKGVETLLKAFVLLGTLRRRGAAPAHLLIIGGDSTNGRLESRSHNGEAGRLLQRAHELGVGNAVQFLGPVGHDRLPAYYSLADVCVVPSFSESFGLVALEAQACGTPVVASRVGGLAQLVKDGLTGFTIPDHSERLFAERIAELLDHPRLRAQFGRRGRLLAHNYSWEQTGERLEELYRTITLPLARSVPSV